MSRIKNLYAKLALWAAPLVVNALLLFIRVVWGWGFFITGKAKRSNIPAFVERFQGWGIPAPTLNVYFVGFLECFGGLLLLAGVFSRPVAFLLAGNMIVALLTAHRMDVFPPLFNDTDPSPLFNAAPFWFLVTSLIIFARGAGWFSIDTILKLILKHRRASIHHVHTPGTTALVQH